LAAINIGQKLAGGGRALSSGGSWLGPHLSLTVEALYRAKCVKTRCFQEGVGHLEPRFQGEGVVPLTIYWYHSKGNWLRSFALQHCRWQFLDDRL